MNGNYANNQNAPLTNIPINSSSETNRFQVRIPPSTSEPDRRQIVRYVNTFAEYTDRTLRTHAQNIISQPLQPTSIRPLDAESIRRSVTAQMSENAFTFSDTNLHSFVQTIGAQMVNAFIEHSRLTDQRAQAQREHNEIHGVPDINPEAMTTRNTSERSSLNEAALRRLTIFIVHERFVTDRNTNPESSRLERNNRESRPSNVGTASRELARVSLRSNARLQPQNTEEASTAYLELRARLAGLRAIMSSSSRLDVNIETARTEMGEMNEEDIMIDLQQTLARLRSGNDTYQRNVRRRTVINESEDEID